VPSEPPGDEQFQCEWIYLDGGVFVTLFGELDTASAPGLRDCLAHLVDEGATRLEVDVSELAFVDSTGLTVMMEQWHRLQAMGGSLALLSPSPPVLRMLEITGLATLLLRPEPAGLFDDRPLARTTGSPCTPPTGTSERDDSATRLRSAGDS
jgi:anti-sigma B factor antagonist